MEAPTVHQGHTQVARGTSRRPRAQAHEPVSSGERSTTDERFTTGERSTTDERSRTGRATARGLPTPSGPSAVPPILSPALRGEGQWTAEQTTPDGRIEIAHDAVRPDPAHPDLTVSLAWMDPATVRFMLIAGTRQPGGGSGPAGAQVPADLQSQLLAAFNSGYKLHDTPGGALEEGHMAGTLQDGVGVVHRPHRRRHATVGMSGTRRAARTGRHRACARTSTS